MQPPTCKEDGMTHGKNLLALCGMSLASACGSDGLPHIGKSARAATAYYEFTTTVTGAFGRLSISHDPPRYRENYLVNVLLRGI
jgi:hypothetical protein